MFHSNDIWVGDGHTFKARVASPIHGKAFRPEVTLVMDWRSRKIVGWSVDLAESTLAVSAAFRDAQLRTRARPLAYYRDNGSGQTGKLIDCDIHGTLVRQGIASETGIPGNPQGRGVMERIWQTVLIPFAAKYPTFLGHQADPETVRKASIQVQKDQRAGVVSALLPGWQQFMADLAAAIDAYNTKHKHSALGGKTPEQAYQDYMDADSLVFGAADDEIHALWLPEVERTPRRGLFELFKNKYYLPGLVRDLPEDTPVRVRFDIHRAETVQVLAMDGTPLGLATWEGNRSAAFPVPYIEHKRKERVARFEGEQAKKVEAKREELMQTIDVPAVVVPEVPLQPAAQQAPAARAVTPAAPAAPARPVRQMGFLETLMHLDAAEQARKGANPTP
jgi:putative transposase